MIRAIRKHPYLFTVLAACTLTLLFSLWVMLQPVRADTVGPAHILTSNVTIQAPQSGGSVYVTGNVDGTAPVTVWIRSVTRDNLLNNGIPQWGNPVTYVPNSPGYSGTYYGYVQAGYGDLLAVKAQNTYYNMLQTDIQQVGYVPAASDSAPPEFNTSYITSSWSNNTLVITVTAYYGLYDPSYPIKATLYQEDNPSNKYTVTFNSTSDYPKTLSISIASNKKARLHAIDNYSNGQSILYNTSQVGSVYPPTGVFVPEPEAAAGERTGNQAVAGIGVQLHNGSFVHQENLFKIRGRVLQLPIMGTHRSRLSYDGPTGRNWDALINSRIQINATTNDITWWPGNGRQELFLFQSNSGLYWQSPIGLLVRLTGASGVYTVSFMDGSKYTYQNNYLQKYDDLNGNSIQFVRNSSGQVFRIIDDLGRIYDLFYYNYKRLAELVDFTGQSVMFDYDSSGNLITITDQANYTRTFAYQNSMLTKFYDRNNRALLENVYATSGTWVNRVITQKRPAGAQAVYSFNYNSWSSSGLVTVTDPKGTQTNYYIDNDTVSKRYLLNSVRVLANSTLRLAVSGYDWTKVPNWIETKYAYNMQNYHVSKTWTEWCPGTAGDCSGGTGVQKTAYTWYDYNSSVQNSSTVDPREFGTLRLVRRDKNVADDLRFGLSLRQSWIYTSGQSFFKPSAYWEERAWRNVSPTLDNQDPSTWVLDDSFKLTYNYSTTGNLLDTTYPNVTQPLTQATIKYTNTYTGYTGQLLTSSEPNDASDPNDPQVTKRFDYYSSGLQNGFLRQRWITVPGAQTPSETYTYDSLGRMVTRTDGLGYSWQFTYDSLDRLLTEQTPNVPPLGNLTTTYVYTGDDLTEVRRTNRDHNGAVPLNEPSELKTRYQYDPLSGIQIKAITDTKKSTPSQPITAETIYEYDSALEVTRIKEQFQVSGYKVQDTLRNERGSVVRQIDYLSDSNEANPPGITDDSVTDTYYDARDNVLEQHDANGLITTFEYDSLGRQIITHMPTGLVSVIEYDDQSEVNPLLNRPAFKTYTYVLSGQTQLRTSQQDSYSDELGRSYLQRVFYDLGAVPKYYEITTWYYKSGRTWREYNEYTKSIADYYLRAYDAAGRLKTEKSPGASGQERVLKTYAYDANNNITTLSVTEWNERTNSPNAYTVTYQYNTLGQRTDDIQGEQTRHMYYDSLGRVRRETFSSLGLEKQTFYDLAGNVEQSWEKIDNVPTWRITSFTTDYLGRVLTKITPNPKVDPANPDVLTTYARDPFGQGRLIRTDLPAVNGFIQSYSFAYDLVGRTVSIVDPNGTEKEFIYHPQKGYLDYMNIFYSAYPGSPPASFAGPWGYGAVDFDYDATGGCSCSGSKEPTVIITRSGGTNPQNGQELSRVTRTFDPLSRLLSETIQVGADQYTVSYEYTYTDPGHYIDGLTYPDGKHLWRKFDANGRIAELTSDVLTGTGTEETVASYRYQGASKLVQTDYQSSAGQYRLQNLASYDSAGRGQQLDNTWRTTQDGANYTTIADWAATYDNANRVVTKKLGYIGSGMQYTFQHDLPGRLTSTDFHAPDAAPPSQYQYRDWSAQDYGRDKAGNANQFSQCYLPTQGSEQCESSGGYRLIRNERGVVTDVQNEHKFGYYYDQGGVLSTVRSKVGPQTRITDANGNTIAMSFIYNINDDPGTPLAGVPPVPCDNEAGTHNYGWSFSYDAWDRLAHAVKSVAGSDCTGTFTYSHTWSFTYDGLGRRVKTQIQSSDPNNKGPSALSGMQNLNFMNVLDRANNIVQHGTRRYLHGPQQMPAMSVASPPQFFMTDVQGNAGSVLDSSSGSLAEEKSTTECGDENPRQSQTNPIHFNIYGNSYGNYEEGLRLADDMNCSPIVLGDNGSAYDSELKDTLQADATSPKTITGPQAKIVTFIDDFALGAIDKMNAVAAYAKVLGNSINVQQGAGMNQALEELIKSANGKPPSNFNTKSWRRFVESKEYRGYTFFAPQITCQNDKVSSSSMATAGESHGFTPFRATRKSGAIKYLEGEGKYSPQESGTGDACMTFKKTNYSRIGPAGQLMAKFLIPGVKIPYNWHSIEYRLCCDKTYEIVYWGSLFPSHYSYLTGKNGENKNGELMQTNESLIEFAFGNKEIPRGKTFKKVAGKID